MMHDARCMRRMPTGQWMAEAPGPVLALGKAAAAGTATAQPAGLVAGSLPVRGDNLSSPHPSLNLLTKDNVDHGQSINLMLRVPISHPHPLWTKVTMCID